MRITSTKILVAIPVFAVLSLLALIAVVIFHQRSTTSQEVPRLLITTPDEDASFVSGGVIPVAVEAPTGLSLLGVDVCIRGVCLETQQTDDVTPYEFSVVVPTELAGTQTLQAIGVDKDGSISQTSVMINIEPPASLVSIEVNPEEVLLFSVGDARRINVRGIFADGVSRVLNSSPETKFSSNNPKVARIAANGDLEAVAPGRVTITVSHTGFSREVKVVVAGSEVRGDLDVDLDVDVDDLGILEAAAGSVSSGPGDPRDLNEDGILDQSDIDLLREECSRPGCAAESPA